MFRFRFRQKQFYDDPSGADAIGCTSRLGPVFGAGLAQRILPFRLSALVPGLDRVMVKERAVFCRHARHQPFGDIGLRLSIHVNALIAIAGGGDHGAAGRNDQVNRHALSGETFAFQSAIDQVQRVGDATRPATPALSRPCNSGRNPISLCAQS